MSTTVVGDIHSAVLSLAGSTITNSVALRRVIEPDQNDLRHPNIGYGVKHLGASSASGVTRVYTLDQSFELLLAKRFVDRDNDSDKQAVMNTLYAQAHAVFIAMINTKLGLASTVLNVEQLEFAEPEVLPNEVALLRAQFVVKYRQSITG